MQEMFDHLPDAAREKLEKTSQPDWLDPMLATLTEDCFSDKNWIYERKLDGERCLAFRSGDELRLMSRNQKELNVRYPELEEALHAADKNRLRHPRFLGLRTDKDAQDVVKEEPKG